MKKIKIDSLNSLKITKITPYKLYFKYNNKCYMILYYSDDETVLQLYERKWVTENRLVIEYMQGVYTSSNIESLYKDVSKGHPTSIVYSNINKAQFVKTLVKLGFAE